MRSPARAAALGLAAGLWLALAPSATPPAWALCPNCLAQQSTVTPTLRLIGVFLLIPFALAAAVVWIVRRLSSYGRAAAAPSPPPSGPSAAPPSPSGAGGVQAG